MIMPLAVDSSECHNVIANTACERSAKRVPRGITSAEKSPKSDEKPASGKLSPILFDQFHQSRLRLKGIEQFAIEQIRFLRQPLAGLLNALLPGLIFPPLLLVGQPAVHLIKHLPPLRRAPWQCRNLLHQLHLFTIDPAMAQPTPLIQ